MSFGSTFLQLTTYLSSRAASTTCTLRRLLHLGQRRLLRSVYKQIPKTRDMVGPKLWAGLLGGGLMGRMAWWRSLVVLEHRNSVAAVGSRIVRTPVGAGEWAAS